MSELRNPAAQKPGPPDPIAQRAAATSAARAAQAAAKLAASGSSAPDETQSDRTH